jgi:group I intron endonuclease
MQIYAITNTVTGKQYIGQTVRDLAARLRAHIYAINKKNRCPAIADAIKKYGPDMFTIRCLEECDSLDHMNEREKHWIQSLSTMVPHGYNLNEGGNGSLGFRHTAESRLKMTKWQLGKKLTPEHRAKVSASLLGNTRARGVKHSDETKAKVSAASKGRKHGPISEDHRRKLAEARLGMKASEEVKQKMSIAHRGERAHNAKLNANDIRAIRADTRKQKEIATDYGINQARVSAIKLRQSWKHVE